MDYNINVLHLIGVPLVFLGECVCINDKFEGAKFMNTYSQAGCTYQCYLEIAAKICGCTPWYFPRVPGTPST